MAVGTSTLDTSHGRIAVADTGSRGPVALLLHGNSAAKEVFARQLDSALADEYRLVAFDLPGHGASDDAADPTRTYTLPGYADLTVEILAKLGIDAAAVLGWSLGGHIGLELVARFPGLKGLMIIGTPPVSITEIGAGFLPSPAMQLTSQEIFSEADVDAYAQAMLGDGAAPVDPALRAAVRRTDGRSRSQLFAALASTGLDHRRIAETAAVPLAVVNGATDPLVNGAFLPTVRYANLWEGTLLTIPTAGHAAFLTAPAIFNPIFRRFLHSVLG